MAARTCDGCGKPCSLDRDLVYVEGLDDAGGFLAAWLCDYQCADGWSVWLSPSLAAFLRLQDGVWAGYGRW